jgi:hypothetical protein
VKDLLWRRRSWKARIGLIVGLVIVLAIIGGTTGGSSSSADRSSSATPPAPVAKPKPATPAPRPKPVRKAKFYLVPRESSCQEQPNNAYIFCSIGVRNIGTATGLPNVYVDFRYSDSGDTIDSYQSSIDNGMAPSDPIPPHLLGWLFFRHPYNALQHDVIQASASLDLNADSWPYVKIVDPSDTGWPFDQH